MVAGGGGGGAGVEDTDGSLGGGGKISGGGGGRGGSLVAKAGGGGGKSVFCPALRLRASICTKKEHFTLKRYKSKTTEHIVKFTPPPQESFDEKQH